MIRDREKNMANFGHSQTIGINSKIRMTKWPLIVCKSSLVSVTCSTSWCFNFYQAGYESSADNQCFQ